MQTRLSFCEIYPAIQAEGPYAGYAAVLLRLFGGNFYDINSSHKYASEDPEKNKRMVTKEELFTEMNALQKGNKAHLIVTGGEPLIQQPALEEFIEFINEKYQQKVFVEIETNGIELITDTLDALVSSYNVQVKF